jgi:large subunit ribosomal protein L30e
MDLKQASREIRRAVDTGKVLFGTRQGEYSVKQGKGKLLILTKNTPVYTAEKMQHIASISEIPVYTFQGTGLELGEVCGKPFVVSSLLVLDVGKSKVADLTEKKKAKKVA